MDEAKLGRDGWSKRATYDEPRLSEMVATYEELGFEVRLEPARSQSDRECSECMGQHPERLQTIYVRER